MIVTITMNPALDKTAEVPSLKPNALNRLENVTVDAGGKGVNVSKIIKILGGESICAGFVGGNPGDELRSRIEAMGIKHSFISIEGVTRTNLKVMDQDGNLTELNEPGISVSRQDLESLFKRVLELSGKDGIVVMSGSLPIGADSSVYADYAKRLREAGRTVIVDADREPFRLALDVPPHVIKPNKYELLQLLGLPQDTNDSELPALCRPFIDKGVAFAALSMGKDGAMFFTSKRSARAKALPVKVLSTVGAGDSMVGAIAFALSRGLEFEETAKLAMACSIGAVTTKGTNPPSKELVDELLGQVKLE